MSALKAETDAKHSDRAGAPQIATKRRKITVEECRRVHAVEAPHVGGARTVETQIGNTNAKRTFAVCDACERHVRFLYQLPTGGSWLCAKCHNLTTRARQQKGTKAEFDNWLTPQRWERMSAKHPALISFYDETGADFRATVEPLDCSKISDEQRASRNARKPLATKSGPICGDGGKAAADRAAPNFETGQDAKKIKFSDEKM